MVSHSLGIFKPYLKVCFKAALVRHLAEKFELPECSACRVIEDLWFLT